MHAQLQYGGSLCQKTGFLFAALLVSQGIAQALEEIVLSHQSRDWPAQADDDSSQGFTNSVDVDNSLFAQPEEVVRNLADLAGASRHLQAKIITNQFDPTTTSFSFRFENESPLQCQPRQCKPTATGLYAGVKITEIQIIVDPDVFNAPAARFRVITDAVDQAGAQAGMCKVNDLVHSPNIAVVNEPWASTSATTISGGGSMHIKSTPAEYIPLTFKMGGIFRLCYSNDGTFSAGHADPLPYFLEVYGVYDSNLQCAKDLTCLTNRPYRCYLLRQAYNNQADSYKAPTSCVVDYSYAGAGFRGLPGVGSWTGEFSTSYDRDTGRVTNLIPRTCAGPDVNDFPADFLCNTKGSCGSSLETRNPFVTPNASLGSKRLPYPVGRNDLLSGLSFKAYTVAACYCPNFHSCGSFSPDFSQQVGFLHFYISKVCPNGYDATDCTLDFNGAAPQHRFALRVECPSNACNYGASNRVKIVRQSALNDLPAWDSSNGCGAAVHGLSSLGINVLPANDNPDVTTMHGGLRQDYKLWNFKNTSSGTLLYVAETSGFMFRMGSGDFELRSRYSGETFDVCYCDGSCETNVNWFKVGQVRFAPFQLVSALSNVSKLQNQFSIEYMNQPGIFGFYRPWIDYGVMGLQEGGGLKFVSDEGLNITDAGCVSAKYELGLTGGGFQQKTADMLFDGATNETIDVNKLIFNGGDPTKLLSINKAGFYSVCYCARPKGNGVCAFNQWVLTNRITIRGPALGQSWSFSTFVVFRIEFAGWGLAQADKIRIIPNTAFCSDEQGNPRAAFTVTNIKVGCPYPCSAVGETNDVLNGDISVNVLSSDTYQCDKQNSNCQTNDIKGITVWDDNTTQLEFEQNPTLADGDLITLQQNIKCDPSSSPTVCNNERLSAIRGRFDYADRNNNNDAAPKEYISGHRVTLMPNPKKVKIPIGWPEPRPKFQVVYAGNRRVGWTRHSKAITKEEIMGTQERLNMKVCWKYTPAMGLAGPTPSYVAQVGTLSLRDSNSMSDCVISLTTLVKSQTSPAAPFILSFRIATADTGRKYTLIQGPTQLRIFFINTPAFYATFSDGATIQNNPGEDDITEAKQYVCGKLFKEVWSSDTVLGFPMPKGCYYRSYGSTQELNMMFESKNGLAPGQYYQLVMNGVATDQAETAGTYANIFTTDDVNVKPYSTIERGVATLLRGPQDPSYGNEGVKFFYPDGISISSGSGTQMFELAGGKALKIGLKGDDVGGGIKANSILRIYLWPLTLWDVPNSCTVTCIPYDQVTAPCGAVQDCKGDAIIPNFQQNFLRLVMPASMTKITQYVTHSLSFPELALPKAGFFSFKNSCTDFKG